MSDKKIDNTLKQILNEANKITLDNKEFDNILNEQNAILCNINHILDKTPEDKRICNKVITKGDKQLNKMIDEFYKMHNLKKPSTDNKTIAIPRKRIKRTKKTSNKYMSKHSSDKHIDKHIDILINKPIVFMKDIAPKYKIKIRPKTRKLNYI